MEMAELESCFGDREGSIKKKKQVCVSVKPYICSVRIRDASQTQGSQCVEQKGKSGGKKYTHNHRNDKVKAMTEHRQVLSQKKEEGKFILNSLCCLRIKIRRKCLFLCHFH